MASKTNKSTDKLYLDNIDVAGYTDNLTLRVYDTDNKQVFYGSARLGYFITDLTELSRLTGISNFDKYKFVNKEGNKIISEYVVNVE